VIRSVVVEGGASESRTFASVRIEARKRDDRPESEPVGSGGLDLGDIDWRGESRRRAACCRPPSRGVILVRLSNYNMAIV
jgi:hypothetical protein